jgi:hypothetical protein
MGFKEWTRSGKRRQRTARGELRGPTDNIREQLRDRQCHDQTPRRPHGILDYTTRGGTSVPVKFIEGTACAGRLLSARPGVAGTVRCRDGANFATRRLEEYDPEARRR